MYFLGSERNSFFCVAQASLFSGCLIMHAESPFEFRALEVFLEAICSFHVDHTTELETDAYPALDDLPSKVLIFLGNY